jgi:hypothetical protein
LKRLDGPNREFLQPFVVTGGEFPLQTRRLDRVEGLVRTFEPLADADAGDGEVIEFAESFLQRFEERVERFAVRGREGRREDLHRVAEPFAGDPKAVSRFGVVPIVRDGVKKGIGQGSDSRERPIAEARGGDFASALAGFADFLQQRADAAIEEFIMPELLTRIGDLGSDVFEPAVDGGRDGGGASGFELGEPITDRVEVAGFVGCPTEAAEELADFGTTTPGDHIAIDIDRRFGPAQGDAELVQRLGMGEGLGTGSELTLDIGESFSQRRHRRIEDHRIRRKR